MNQTIYCMLLLLTIQGFVDGKENDRGKKKSEEKMKIIILYILVSSSVTLIDDVVAETLMKRQPLQHHQQKKRSDEEKQSYSFNPTFKNPTYMQHVNKKLYTPGEDVILLCASNGIKPIMYKWFFNGMVVQQNERKKRLKLSGNKSMLKVKRIRESDIGIYTCVARNAYGILSYDYKIKLKDKQKAPVFYDLKVMKRKQVAIRPTRQNAYFECQADGQDVIHYLWLKNGSPFKHIKSNSNHKRSEGKMNGNYKQYIGNSQMHGSNRRIFYGAYNRLYGWKSHGTHRRGYEENAHLKNIQNKVEMRENEEIQSGNLLLKNLKTQDGGLYTCIAINKYGNASFTYELRILRKLSGGPPKVVPYTRPETIRVKSGANVSLDCLEIMSATIPDVRWFQLYDEQRRQNLPEIPHYIYWNNVNDVSYNFVAEYISPDKYTTFNIRRSYNKPSDPYLYDDTDPYGLRLSLTNVTPRDTGVYACYVSNLEGNDYATFNLIVEKPHSNE